MVFFFQSSIMYLPKTVTSDHIVAIIEPEAHVKHELSPSLSLAGEEGQYHDTTDEVNTPRWRKYWQLWKRHTIRTQWRIQEIAKPVALLELSNRTIH